MSFRGSRFHERLTGFKEESADLAARKVWVLVSCLTAAFVPSAKSLSYFCGFSFSFSFRKVATDGSPALTDLRHKNIFVAYQFIIRQIAAALVRTEKGAP